MADGIVGFKIAQYLSKQYPGDLFLIVTIKKNNIYKFFKKNGFNVLAFESEEIILKKLNHKEVDLGILAWWPNIIRSPLIDYPKQGFLNTHPSFLPYNRGKHFSFWAIVEQAPFGVSIHCVSNNIDSGDIIAQKEINYNWCDNGESLYYKSQEEMLNLFIKTYPSLHMGCLSKKKQDMSKGSYHLSCEIEEASKINLDDLYTGRDILNKLRARTFSGHPSCWFEDENIVYDVSIEINKKK